MDVIEAVFLGWLVVAVVLLGYCRVFSRADLALGPTRQSWLSLPVVGAIILAYLLVNTAVVVGAIALGVISLQDVVPAKTPAATQTQAAATQMATLTQTATAASQLAETVPASQAGGGGGESASHIVALNGIGAVSYGIMIIPVLIVVPLLFRERFRGWGLALRQIPKGVVYGLLAFVIVYPLVTWWEFILGTLYEYFHHHVEEHSTFQALEQAPGVGQQVLLYGMAVLVAPVVEEIFFRGILQTALLQRGWGLLVPQLMRPGVTLDGYRPTARHRWGAIVLAAGAFAGVHQLDAAPVIFALALGLGYVYERTGILWASIVLHVAFNTAQLAIHGL